MKKEMEGRAEIGEEEREIGDKEISEMSNLFVSRLRKQQRSEKEARKEEVRCCLRQKEKEGFFHCTFFPILYLGTEAQSEFRMAALGSGGEEKVSVVHPFQKPIFSSSSSLISL
jgi:hypothetical protein